MDQHHVVPFQAPVAAANQDQFAAGIKQLLVSPQLSDELQQFARRPGDSGSFHGSHAPEQAHSPSHFRTIGSVPR